MMTTDELLLEAFQKGVTTDELERLRNRKQLESFRRALRKAILAAHGVGSEATDVMENYWRDKREVFGKSSGEVFDFCTWRDWEGKLHASGELPHFLHTPVISRLLDPEGVSHWDAFMCFNLGRVERLENCGTTIVMPKIGVVLFPDELVRLFTGSRVATDCVGGGYGGKTVEAFAVMPHQEWKWPILFGIRAYKSDD